MKKSLLVLASTCFFASYASAAEDIIPWEGTPSPEIAEALEQHPEAVQISETAIAWKNGAVVLNFALEMDDETLRATNFHGCPAGKYCFYDAQNWNEGTSGYRRLDFSDCSKNGTTQFLNEYGFDRNVTSWVTHKASLKVVKVYDRPGNLLWNEGNNAQSANVGPQKNDKADKFVCFTK